MFLFPTVLNDVIEDMAEQFQTHFKIEDLSHVALPVQVCFMFITLFFCIFNQENSCFCFVNILFFKCGCNYCTIECILDRMKL